MFSHELWDGRDMKEHGMSLLLLSAETSGDIHNFSVAINKSSIILNAKFSPELSPAVSTPSSLKRRHALDWGNEIVPPRHISLSLDLFPENIFNLVLYI